MDIFGGLIVIFVIYCVLIFFDTFFKSCAHYPYIRFLQGTGVKIKIFHIHWTTTAFNRILVRWGSSYVRALNLWYTVGLYCTLLLLPFALFLVLYALVQILVVSNQTSAIEDQSSPIIEFVIPGVNLPMKELGYYTVTLAFCSAFHELGHALAAIKEDVHLLNVGFSLFFIIPVAYVNLSTDRLHTLHPWRLLKILCAGVWHNIVLAFYAYLIYLTVPYFFSYWFYVNNGVYVTQVEPRSPLIGPRGLAVSDMIVKVDDCVVIDEISWTSCLVHAGTSRVGFCIDANTVHELDESVPTKHLANGAYDCCGPNKPDRLCFEYADEDQNALELPQHSCLPARKIIESHRYFCNAANSQSCPDGLHCIYPSLPNATSLIKIRRVQKADVIYIGHYTDVLYSVQISPFIPKHVFSTPSFPDTVMKLLRYLIFFSLGLALINVVPCVFMDGQHIINALGKLTFEDASLSRLVSTILTLFGTCLLLFHSIHTLWTKLLK